MIHFISYGDDNFTNSKKRLLKESSESGWFDNIVIYEKKDIDSNFSNKFKDILNKRRGGGYWLWKPYFINKKLMEINTNDILIYIDVGCTINVKGKQRFEEYIEMLKNSNEESMISFCMENLLEEHWTTKEIFQYFDVDSNTNLKKKGQFVGGIIILKKNENCIQIIKQWMDTLYSNPLLFTNEYKKNQIDKFRENRHDQSIFSVIRKMNKTIVLKDETYFSPFGNNASLKFPFWATRLRDKRRK